MLIGNLGPAGRLAAGLIISFCLTVSSLEAEEIAGEAVAVQPNATLNNSQGRVTLQIGMDVHQGDIVRTSGRGEAQLIFTDETKLVVGPNSSLVIESYLLRSGNRANSFAVRALGGSFRMITGRSDKSAYRIMTPTAAIGVRGTAFDLFVEHWRGITDMFLYDGAADLCTRFNCVTVTETCNVARASQNLGARYLARETEIVDSLARRLPYFVSDEHLAPGFRLQPKGCSTERIARVNRAVAQQRGRSPIHDRGTHQNDRDPERPTIDRPEPEQADDDDDDDEDNIPQ